MAKPGTASETCVFCFRQTRNRAQLTERKQDFAICERCMQDIRSGKKTVEDVKNRLAELQEMLLL